MQHVPVESTIESFGIFVSTVARTSAAEVAYHDPRTIQDHVIRRGRDARCYWVKSYYLLSIYW
jgi:hypothetical protein